MPKTRHLAITLFCLLLALPAVQMLVKVVPEPTLTGVVSDAKRPPFEWRGVSRGDFQTGFETWLNQHMGLRAYAIRTDAQINLSCFRESSIKTADVPIVGRRNFVYARVYIDGFNRRRSTGLTAPEAFAQKLRRLQDGLRRHGKAFVFVIAPSKAEIYPEYIPPRFLDASPPCDDDSYLRLIAALRREGVWTVDGHAQFMKHKRGEPWLLFAPGGIHWLAYGAAFVLEDLTRALEAQTGHPMVHLECESIAAASAPESDDDVDIARLLNTWELPRWDVQVPRPRYRARAVNDVRRPHLLVVGDSFAFGLIDLMKRYDVLEGLDLYYYYSVHYRYPGGASSPLNKDGLEWEREVSSVDAVILEINEVQLDSAAWGFVDDAIKRLDAFPTGAPAGRSNPDGP